MIGPKQLLVVWTLGWLLLAAGSAAIEPIEGCCLAAYLGDGQNGESYVAPGDFGPLTGKAHAAYSRYFDVLDLEGSAHWNWADSLVAVGASPIFFIGAYEGTTWTALTNGELDSTLVSFARDCRNQPVAVLVAFCHEMNGWWYPWGQQPDDYVATFRHVSDLLRGTASNIEMCWVPLQAWGYPWGGPGPGLGYDEYWPGPDFVDWVGLNVYDRDWDEDNAVAPDIIAAALGYLDFYQVYSAGHANPMMIAETALFDANWDPTDPGVRVPLTESQLAAEKNQWISELYDPQLLGAQFPNVNMICYFHVQKPEEGFSTQTHDFGTVIADWRIPLADSVNTYSALISDAYFLPEYPGNGTGVEEHGSLPDEVGERLLWSYPNPCDSATTLAFCLPRRGVARLAVYDVTGRLVRTLVDGAREAGSHSISWDARDDRGLPVAGGAYFCHLAAHGVVHTALTVLVP